MNKLVRTLLYSTVDVIFVTLLIMGGYALGYVFWMYMTKNIWLMFLGLFVFAVMVRFLFSVLFEEDGKDSLG